MIRVSRRRAAAIALAVAFSCLGASDPAFAQAPSSAIAPSAFPRAPLGLDWRGTEYALVSNRLWTAGAGPAKMVRLWQKGNSAASTALSRQDDGSIWSATCVKGAQKVIFKRTYFLPGPAKTAAIDILGQNAHALSNMTVLLRINSQSFNIRLDRWGSFRLAEGVNKYAKAFRFGDNKIELHVTKRAEKYPSLHCRAGSQVSLRFLIRGQFAADVAVTRVAGSKVPIYRAIPDGSRGIARQRFLFHTVRNSGPSGAFEGWFSVDVYATVNSGAGFDFLFVKLNSQLRAPLGPCKQIDKATNWWQLECEIHRLPLGTAIQAPLDLEVTAAWNAAVVKEQISVTLRINSPTNDPIRGNNETWTALHLCGQGATDPKCATATGAQAAILAAD